MNKNNNKSINKNLDKNNTKNLDKNNNKSLNKTNNVDLKKNGNTNLKKSSNTNKPSVQFINNPNFHFGSNVFLLNNTDCYIGGFCSHKSGIVWREGLGVYNTSDGHSYQGFWENDRLNGTETIIKYPSGAQYFGSLKRGKYSGTGTMVLNSEVKLNCNFQKNIPRGAVIMIDRNNITWKGTFNVDQAILMPENSFFSKLTYDIGRENKK